MRFLSMRTGRGICVTAFICLSLTAAEKETATSRIVSAENAFLSTLEQKERQTVLFALTTKSNSNGGPILRRVLCRAAVSA